MVTAKLCVHKGDQKNRPHEIKNTTNIEWVNYAGIIEASNQEVGVALTAEQLVS